MKRKLLEYMGMLVPVSELPLLRNNFVPASAKSSAKDLFYKTFYIPCDQVF